MKKIVAAVMIVLGLFGIYFILPNVLACVRYYSTSEFERNLEKVNKDIALNPSDAKNYGFRGYLYKRNKMYNLAVRDFLKEHDLDNDLWDVNIDISNAYLGLGDANNAYKYINNLIAQFPKLGVLRYNLAIINDYEGKSSEAIKNYSITLKTISVDDENQVPRYRISLKRRAVNYLKVDDIAKAKMDLEQYIKLDDKDIQVNKLMKILERNDAKQLKEYLDVDKIDVDEVINL